MVLVAFLGSRLGSTSAAYYGTHRYQHRWVKDKFAKGRERPGLWLPRATARWSFPPFGCPKPGHNRITNRSAQDPERIKFGSNWEALRNRRGRDHE
jgi:hypothetical protein